MMLNMVMVAITITEFSSCESLLLAWAQLKLWEPEKLAEPLFPPFPASSSGENLFWLFQQLHMFYNIFHDVPLHEKKSSLSLVMAMMRLIEVDQSLNIAEFTRV